MRLCWNVPTGAWFSVACYVSQCGTEGWPLPQQSTRFLGNEGLTPAFTCPPQGVSASPPFLCPSFRLAIWSCRRQL